MKSRNWVFTLNNPEDNQQWMSNSKIKLIIFQLEKGESGTLHLQGYLELESPRAISYLKKLNGKAHWETRRGSREEAILYCIKEDRVSPPTLITKDTLQTIGEQNSSVEELKLILTEHGILKSKSPTSKEELNIIKSLLDDGKNMEYIADNYFYSWCRFHRALERYVLLKSKPRTGPTTVIIIQGPTGTGKSRFAMERYPNGYWKQRSNWWDGYNGQKEIIIDEFYGWIPFDLLLRICDRYPLMLETKGGQVQCQANTIVITSNKRPDNWYNNVYFESFIRRVNKIIIMKELGQRQIYDKYDANIFFNC